MGVEVAVHGLSNLDVVEFRELLADGYDERVAEDVGVDTERPVDGGSGEPVTISIIVGAVALKALIAFLVVRNSGQHFSEEIEIRQPNGTVIKRRVSFRIRSGIPLGDQLLEELSTISDLPITEFVA